MNALPPQGTVTHPYSSGHDRQSRLNGDKVRQVGAWWTVALLCSFYIISYIDRIIPSLLVGPLKEDFAISDFQIGILFGGAFALFYGLLGLPIARVADLSNRKFLICAGVALWSMCTLASGLAVSFSMLIILRMGLAIGEASLSPAAYSMIGDLFPPEQRSLPAAIYAAAGNVGTYGSYIAGASILSLLSSNITDQLPALANFKIWQIVFFAVAGPGLIVGLVFLLTTQEPSRSTSGRQKAFGLKESASYFAQRYRLFTGLFLGAASITVIIFAYGAWAPEYFRRTFDWSVSDAGLAYGGVGVCASALGTLGFTFLSEYLKQKGRKDGLVIAAIVAAMLGCLSGGLAPLAPDGRITLCCLAIMIFSLSGCSNLIVISIQFIVPSGLRATAIAIMFMCTTLVGLGLGPTLVALLSKPSLISSGGLAPALAIISISMLMPATALLFWARRAYVRQTVNEPELR